MPPALCWVLWKKYSRRIHPLHSRTLWSSWENKVHAETTWEQKLLQSITRCKTVLWKLRALCIQHHGRVNKKKISELILVVEESVMFGLVKKRGVGRGREAGMSLWLDQEGNSEFWPTDSWAALMGSQGWRGACPRPGSLLLFWVNGNFRSLSGRSPIGISCMSGPVDMTAPRSMPKITKSHYEGISTTAPGRFFGLGVLLKAALLLEAQEEGRGLKADSCWALSLVGKCSSAPCPDSKGPQTCFPTKQPLSLANSPASPIPTWPQAQPSSHSGSHDLVSAWILVFGVSLVILVKAVFSVQLLPPNVLPMNLTWGAGVLLSMGELLAEPLSLCFSPVEDPRTLSQTSDANSSSRIRTAAVMSFGSCDLAAESGHLSVTARTLIHLP